MDFCDCSIIGLTAQISLISPNWDVRLPFWANCSDRRQMMKLVFLWAKDQEFGERERGKVKRGLTHKLVALSSEFLPLTCSFLTLRLLTVRLVGWSDVGHRQTCNTHTNRLSLIIRILCGDFMSGALFVGINVSKLWWLVHSMHVSMRLMLTAWASE